MQREGDTAVWSADIDTYVYFGQAKENRKFFTDTVYYHISAEYDTGTVTTEECVVQCDQYYGNVYDYSSLPYLLITEIVPATSAKGVGNGDKFEFIELYNNSDQPIDLSGYELHYMTAPSTRPTEYTWRKLDNTDIVIPARGTVVIWCNTNDWQNATALPASDMLEYYYGTEDEPKTDWNLPADFTFTSEGENANLTYTHFSGMPNSGQHRGWQLVTNTGELVVEAYYNVNNDTSNNTDVTSDYGIQFRYPTDGGKRMQKISANVVRANPGRVLTYQVPSATVDMPDDTEAPVINYAHRDTDIRAVEADGIDHEIWASVTDDTIVNTVWLEYKISSADYTPENTVLQSFLRDGETSFYCAYMDFGGFIRQSTFVYRIIARDIVGHETMTEWYSVNIIPYEDEIENTGLRTNIKNGDYVTGSVTLSATETDAQKAAGITMEIDGEPYEVSPDNETYALFVYEVYQTDFNFLNGVTIKNETFDTDTDHEILFNFDISGKWTTYTVRIPLDKILPTAENPDGGLIGLHCGNRYTPIYDPARFAAAIEAYRAAKAVNDAEGMRKASADFIYGDNRSKTEYDCSAELDETGYNLNRDDYEYRDVRLILPDGTVLYDTNPANGGKYSESNRDEIYKFSDSSASDTRQAYFKFDVPADKIDTRSVRIDTTQYADGEHTWTVKSGDTTETVTFYIDNTAPEFTFPFADGETLKGSLSLAPTVDETGSGVGRMYGYLDGNRVGIPYYVKSGTLEPGLHTLECTVEDGVGNVTTKTVTFRTEAETPTAPGARIRDRDGQRFERHDVGAGVRSERRRDDGGILRRLQLHRRRPRRVYGVPQQREHGAAPLRRVPGRHRVHRRAVRAGRESRRTVHGLAVVRPAVSAVCGQGGSGYPAQREHLRAVVRQVVRRLQGDAVRMEHHRAGMGRDGLHDRVGRQRLHARSQTDSRNVRQCGHERRQHSRAGRSAAGRRREIHHRLGHRPAVLYAAQRL